MLIKINKTLNKTYQSQKNFNAVKGNSVMIPYNSIQV